jgi:hypothetical protein
MSLRRSRLASPVLLAVAGLAFAGCGGGGGGDEGAYVKTYEGACKSIANATSEFAGSAGKLQTEIRSNPDKAMGTFRDGFAKVLDTFGDQMQVLADAEAPKQWEDFQKSVSDAADDTEKGIAQAKDRLADLRTPADIAKVGTAFQGLNIGKGMQQIPKDLAKKAPSCSGLGGAASAA